MVLPILPACQALLRSSSAHLISCSITHAVGAWVGHKESIAVQHAQGNHGLHNRRGLRQGDDGRALIKGPVSDGRSVDLQIGCKRRGWVFLQQTGLLQWGGQCIRWCGGPIPPLHPPALPLLTQTTWLLMPSWFRLALMFMILLSVLTSFCSRKFRVQGN